MCVHNHSNKTFSAWYKGSILILFLKSNNPMKLNANLTCSCGNVGYPVHSANNERGFDVRMDAETSIPPLTGQQLRVDELPSVRAHF